MNLGREREENGQEEKELNGLAGQRHQGDAASYIYSGSRWQGWTHTRFLTSGSRPGPFFFASRMDLDQHQHQHQHQRRLSIVAEV